MRPLQATLIACLITLAPALPAGAQAKPISLCELPKNKVMADLQYRLDNRYPSSDMIRVAQYRAAESDYEALCARSFTAHDRELLAELTARHYPSVTLIRSFYESLLNTKVEH